MTARWIGALLLLACASSVTPPGDEQMGSYAFHAVPKSAACGLRDVPPGPFDFKADFSRQRDGGGAWVTIATFFHDAGWDGQRMLASYDAPRSFSDCTQCGSVTMQETLDVVLLSKSQSDALHGGCSDMPPFDPDAGITRPGPTSSSYDAVHACGTLKELVTANPKPVDDSDAGCLKVCDGCALEYTLTGDRR